MPKKYKRPGYKSCGRMVYSDASKALKMVSTLKTLVNVERKHFDDQTTATVQSETPILHPLAIVLQNATGTGRNGDQIKTLGSRLSYLIKISASAASTQFRVLLIQDKQCNGALPAAGDVLEDVTVTDAMVSPINLDNKYRFRILHDKVHQLSISGNQSVYVRRQIKHMFKVRYDATAGAITDLTSNNLFLMLISSETTNTPVITFHHRLRFVDN